MLCPAGHGRKAAGHLNTNEGSKRADPVRDLLSCFLRCLAVRRGADFAGALRGNDREFLVKRVYSGTNWYRINGIQSTMELHDTQEKHSTLEISNRKPEGQPETMIRRAEQLAEPERAHGLLPFSVRGSTRECGRDLAVWCVLSIVLLLCPTLVRDRLRRTRAMQWTSRRGRSILNTQMAAALCSALALTAINLVVYAVPFLAREPLQFLAPAAWAGSGPGARPGSIGPAGPVAS